MMALSIKLMVMINMKDDDDDVENDDDHYEG